MTLIFEICLCFAILLGTIFLFMLLQKRYFPEESKPQTVQQPPVSAEEYCRVGEVLISCISANFGKLGLCRPSELPQHSPPWPQGIRIRGSTVVLVYLFDRMGTFSISHGKAQTQYTTMDTGAMKKILNGVLPNYAIADGLPPYIVTEIKSLENGRVEISVMPA